MANKGQAKKKRAAASEPRMRQTIDLYEVFHGDPSAEAAAGERLIHQRTRLAIVSMLAVNKSLTFNELKEMLDTTDGNLSVHARKLEEAGYVDCRKSFACERIVTHPFATRYSRSSLPRANRDRKSDRESRLDNSCI